MPTAHPAAGVTVGVRENPTSYQPVPGDSDDSAGPREADRRNACCRPASSTAAGEPTAPRRAGAPPVPRRRALTVEVAGVVVKATVTLRHSATYARVGGRYPAPPPWTA